MSSLKRPLAALGFSMFLTVLCAVSFGNTALVVTMTVLAAIIILIFMIVKTRHSHILITFGIGMILACLLLLNTQYHHDLTVSMCGEDRNVEAVVASASDFSQDNSRYYVEAKLKSVDSVKAYGKIRLSFSRSADDINPDSLKIGDKISFVGYIYKIGTDNDDVHNSFTANGIYTGAYGIENLEINSPSVRPLSYYTDLLKQAIINRLSFSFDNKVSGLIIGILTGDKDYCYEEVYRAFRISGAAHILAVSGLHMSIWISVFGALFSHIRRNRKLAYIPVLIFVTITVFVANFSPSVCRAALMSVLMLIGKMIGEDDDSLNSLGFSMVCLLCANVYMIYSVAFQLTFICMFSIIAVARPVCKMAGGLIESKINLPALMKQILYTLCCGMIISITVSVFTFPVCAMNFGYVSLLSPVTNSLIIPVCAPLMVMCLLFLALGFIPVLSDVILGVIELLSGYMIKVTDYISSFTFSSVSTGEYEVVTWLIIVAVLGFIFVLYRLAHRYFARFVTAALALFVIFSYFASADRSIEDYTLRLIGNGSEVTAVLVYNRKSVIIGAYDRYYFTQEADFVSESEDSDNVAVVVPEDTNKRFLEYLCADLEAENLIYDGESITLYSKIKVINKGDYAVIEGNGRKIAIIYKDELQPNEYCDIIISVDCVNLKYADEIYSDDNLRYGSVRVDGNGGVSIRGEKFWQSLMKKS